MNKKLLLKLLILFTWFSSGQNNPNYKENFIIATGSRGGNYYKTGKFIAHKYNEYQNKYRFQIIETNGSVENIELLKNNAVDFALVQRDILLKNLYDEDQGTKNVTVITPLFQEKLWIYYKGDKDLNIKKLDSFSNLKNKIIGFTNKKGSTYDIYKKTVRFLNIDISGIKEIDNNYNKLISDFKNDSIHLLLTFSLPLEALDSLPGVHKMYLSEKDAKFLEQRLPNLYMTEIGDSKYSLGSWTFLVGSKTSISRISPKKFLLNALIEKINDKNNRIQHYITSSYHQFTQNKFNETKQLRSIPVFPYLRSKIFFKTLNYRFLAFLLFVAFLLLLINRHYTGKWIPKYNLLFFWNRYKHFQLGFLVLIIIYFSSVELLINAEKNFYEETKIKSQILNKTRADLHSWLLVTTVTGNSNGVFPQSLTGKIMLALNSLNFWIGTILIGVSEYLTYKINQKRKKGIMKTKYENHLVIFGWNQSTPKFILEILNDAKVYNDTQVKMVLVTPDIQKVREQHEEIKKLHDNKIIDIIEGDARDSHILEKANIVKAHTIVLLSEGNSLTSDEHVLLRALAITRFVKKAAVNNKQNEKKLFKKILQLAGFKEKKETVGDNNFFYDRAYMIAEINNEEFRESLIDADVNEIVVAGNYRKSIMKQSIFNHGISKVLDEIMQYNEYNEFYKIDLSKPENAHLREKTFDEILVLLRKKGILLIGIHIIFYEEGSNKIIIDQSRIKNLLQEKENGIARDIILNPVNEIEKNRKTDDNDHLIVLALNVKMLRKGISELKKESSLN